MEKFDSILEKISKDIYYVNNIDFTKNQFSNEELYKLHLVIVNNKKCDFIEYLNFDKFSNKKKYILYLNSIKQSGINIQYALKDDNLNIKDVKFYNLCLASVDQSDDKRYVNQTAIKYILNSDRLNFTDLQYYTICSISVNQTIHAINHILESDKLNFTDIQWYNIYENAIKMYGYSIYKILQFNRASLSNDQFYNLISESIVQNCSLQYISTFDKLNFTKVQSYSLFEQAITQDAQSILEIKHIIKDHNVKITYKQFYDLSMIVFKKMGYLLYFANEKEYKIKQTKEMCLAAVTSPKSCDNNGFISRNTSKSIWPKRPEEIVYHAIQFVKKRFLTYNLCMASMKSDGLSIQCLDFNKLKLSTKQKKNLWTEAIKENKDAIDHILKIHNPNVDEREFICSVGINEHDIIIDYIQLLLMIVPIITASKLCIQAINKNWKYIKHIKMDKIKFSTKQINEIYKISCNKNKKSIKFMQEPYKSKYKKIKSF